MLLRQVWFSIVCVCVCACVCAIVFFPVILAVSSSLSMFCVCFALELSRLCGPYFFSVFFSSLRSVVSLWFAVVLSRMWFQLHFCAVVSTVVF